MCEINLCHLGCGQEAKFFHKITNIGRCSQNVSSCPARSKEQKAINEAKRKIRLEEKQKEIENRIPQKCNWCEKTGQFYNERSGLWRCEDEPLHCTGFREQRDNILIEKYGTSKIAHIEGVQDQRSDTLKQLHANRTVEERKEWAQTMQDTMEEKYGSRYALNVSEFKEKSKKTTKKNFGVEYSLQSPIVRQKSIETNLHNYGVEHPQQSPVIQAKTKATNMLRYGVEYIYQNPEFFQKAITNSFREKEFTFPSGNVINLLGFEPSVMKKLLDAGYIEEDFSFGDDIPVIIYYDDIGNKHYYYSDIFIPELNHIIEVKSEWRYKNDLDVINLKMNATKALGYKYTIFLLEKEKSDNYRLIGDNLPGFS